MNDDPTKGEDEPGQAPDVPAEDECAATLVDAAYLDEDDPAPAQDEERRPWREGPDDGAPEESWLSLGDDELLHQIETVGAEHDLDDRLLEVVSGDRHFFIRQEAAKRVHDRTRLFAFEEDRHVGQILVRHLTRREDLTYLERLAIRCRHVEVRSAAQVQLARVWKWLETSYATPAAASRDATALGAASDLRPSPSGRHQAMVPLAREGVDASLLGWAAHFIVEQAWTYLGTTATRELLRRTRNELVGERDTLAFFNVNDDARVVTDITPGARIARGAVRDVAAWMVAFRAAADEVAPGVPTTSIRACTALMADALREAGFYAACDDAEVSARRSS